MRHTGSVLLYLLCSALVAGCFFSACLSTPDSLREYAQGKFLDVQGSDLDDFTHESASVVVGDINGDDDVDIVFGNRGAANLLYINSNTGDLFDEAAMFGEADVDSASLALGKINDDDFLDLVVGNLGSANELFFGGASGGFSSAMPLESTMDDSTQSIAVDYINDDAFLDIVVGNEDQADTYYLNDGSGRFSQGVEIPGDINNTMSVALGDVDGDEIVDLVAGIFGGANRLYSGTGQGFGSGVDISNDSYLTTSVALNDLDGDGDLDLVAGSGEETMKQPNHIYFNNGDGTFQSAQILGDDENDTSAIAVADVDVDGDLDIVVGNFGDANILYLNNGTDTPFDGVTRIVIGSDDAVNKNNTLAIALGDVDGDGYLDLVEGNLGLNRIYVNQ